MPHHTNYFLITQLLCNCGSLPRVSGIVFCSEFKFDLLSTNHQSLCIQILNGQANPVFRIFSNVSNPTRHWTGMRDFYNLNVLRMRRSSDKSTSSHNSEGTGSKTPHVLMRYRKNKRHETISKID